MSVLEKVKYKKTKNNTLPIKDNIPTNFISIKNEFNKNDPYRMSNCIGFAIACNLLSLKSWEPIFFNGKFHIIIEKNEFEELKNSNIYHIFSSNSGQHWLNFLKTKESIKIASDTILDIYKYYNHPNVISSNSSVPKGLQNDLVDKYNSL